MNISPQLVSAPPGIPVDRMLKSAQWSGALGTLAHAKYLRSHQELIQELLRIAGFLRPRRIYFPGSTREKWGNTGGNFYACSFCYSEHPMLELDKDRYRLRWASGFDGYGSPSVICLVQ